jgi:hypothetical protein
MDNTYPNTLPFWSYYIWHDNENAESWNHASVIESSTAMQLLVKTKFCGNDDVPNSWKHASVIGLQQAHQFSQGMHISQSCETIKYCQPAPGWALESVTTEHIRESL